MQVPIAEAHALATACLVRIGYEPVAAERIANHLIDCELRGLGFSGLARILSVAERCRVRPVSRQPMAIERETPVSAAIDGGDIIGYLVAERATDLAVTKARQAGIAVVGARNTWYTGMLSYYAEKAVAQDLVVMLASNATPWVAPHGGSQARFGTNPICFGFPSDDEPVIWDIGTSGIIHAQVVLAWREGRKLPENMAFDAAGAATTDPAEALAGALAPWGGHRGGGLGLVVQMLGMLAGSPMMPGHLQDFGFLALCIRPDLLVDAATFKQQVAEFSRSVRATRPLAGGGPVRMPFDRSRADRERRLGAGVLDIAEPILEALAALRPAADGLS